MVIDKKYVLITSTANTSIFAFILSVTNVNEWEISYNSFHYYILDKHTGEYNFKSSKYKGKLHTSKVGLLFQCNDYVECKAELDKLLDFEKSIIKYNL